MCVCRRPPLVCISVSSCRSFFGLFFSRHEMTSGEKERAKETAEGRYSACPENTYYYYYNDIILHVNNNTRRTGTPLHIYAIHPLYDDAVELRADRQVHSTASSRRLFLFSRHPRFRGFRFFFPSRSRPVVRVTFYLYVVGIA